MQDCGYVVRGAVATTTPVIGNTLKISGSKGKATKGVARHLKWGRETGSLMKKKAFSNDTKISTTQKRTQIRVA